jgi:hypothetical protein
VRAVEIALDAWDECVTLVLLGDLHLGHAQTNEKLVEAVARRLEAPHTYWLDLGDTIDAINMHDPRFDPRSLPTWIGLADLIDLPAAQVARYRHYFGRLGATCWARVFGNHELALQRHTERDIYAELNRAIGLEAKRALGYSGFVRLRFRQMAGAKVANTWTQTIYLSHGAGGGKLAGAKAGGLERLAMAYEADIYATGHTHTKLVLQKRALGLSPRTLDVVDKGQVMVNVGAFMDGREGYPEYKGLYPQAMGPVELQFYPAEKLIKVVQ